MLALPFVSTSVLPPLASRSLSAASSRLLRPRICCSSSSYSSSNDIPFPLQDYDPSLELLGLDVQPGSPNPISNRANMIRSFGPNGQYMRELPCPSCRGRGYVSCTECGKERSRADCSECNGKDLITCQQCYGDRVIWEEFIDEKPWEKARSSSPFKVKEDDEVDKLEINVDSPRRSTRVYGPLSLEVRMKISQSLKALNAKTGLFSKRMKILHGDPELRARRIAAIKKSKRSAAARKEASETMEAYFQDPNNRIQRSIAMKGLKFYCSHCGEEGHRRFYCPTLFSGSNCVKYRCRSCGEYGHNSITCGKESKKTREPRVHLCKVCNQTGHNRRTCPQLVALKSDVSKKDVDVDNVGA